MQICAAVIGAGSWGTTVAHLLAHNTSTVLWARDPEVAQEVSEHHMNSRYLPGHELHANLRATASFEDAVRQADVLVMGVPSHGFRSTLEQVAEHLRAWVPVVSLTKGLEQRSRLRMTEVIAEVLEGHRPDRHDLRQVEGVQERRGRAPFQRRPPGERVVRLLPL